MTTLRLPQTTDAAPADRGPAPGSEPFVILRPARQSLPFVFASPHSGRDYPLAFLAEAQLDALTLRRSEDCFVDELYDFAPGAGAPLIAARFPRAYCDANRAPDELDPAVFEEAPPAGAQTRSPRVAAGLGVIARVVKDGAEIYRGKLPIAEAERRLRLLHRPYHAALARLVEETRAAFGFCILFDCHSMPGAAAAQGLRRSAPDIVLGDRFGASCSPALTDAADRVLSHLGFQVARNNPYAGGFTVESYGRPHQRVHALQIELLRSLYLDEERIERREPSFRHLRERLQQFLHGIAVQDWSALRGA